MKKNQVKVGRHYEAKVSGKLTVVRILNGNAHGGWDAVNIETTKPVRIKTAQRLRRAVDLPVKAAAPEADRGAQGDATPKGKAKGKKAVKKATRAATGDDAAAPKKARKPSGLDLAAKALGEAKEPLNARQIAEKAIELGWQTKGKTPHATLYAAIIREIAAKGKDARFRKTARGKFALAS